VVGEELARAGAPAQVGAGLLAAMALVHFGSQAHKERYLPPIRDGRELWCQLFSEPGAGSDLASLTTRARRDDDCYVVDGQKVWTTNGQHADFGYLLARTDPSVAKQAGITAFVVDMRTPGIDVRPLREITGTTDFNEVFFDGVRIPAGNVIGEVDGGWQVATTSLGHERSAAGGGAVTTVKAAGRLVESARERDFAGGPALSNPHVRQSLGRVYAAARTSMLLGHYNMSRAQDGTGDAGDAPVAKVFFSEANLALAETAMDLQGGDALWVEGEPRAVADGWWQDAFLYARAYTIAGGANEVLRNLIAERALGLPRDPSPNRDARAVTEPPTRR
jgi:alkylation response protein AidB-like acyl-CoA dehydrogenase